MIVPTIVISHSAYSTLGAVAERLMSAFQVRFFDLSSSACASVDDAVTLDRVF